MTTRCNQPDLRCADPDHHLLISDEEQVLLVVEVGLVAALLDGQVPPAESEALATAIRLLPGLRGLTEEQLNLLLMRAGERTRQGDSWLCEVARGLTHPALRRVAFRMAALFCSFDGVIEEREQEYLNWLARAFEFSSDQTAMLFAEATNQERAGAVRHLVAEPEASS